MVARQSKRLIRNFWQWVKNYWRKLSWPLAWRSEVSLGQNFENLTCHSVPLQSATPAPRTRKVKMENFDQERVFRFGTLHQWCVKFLTRIFTRFGRPMPKNSDLVVLSMVWPNGTFDQRATKTWVRYIWGATTGQIFKILTWRDFVPLHQWFQKIPSRIFYPFWAPHSWKLRIGLFHHSATKWCFWPASDQNLGSVLLTVVRLFPYLGTFDQ